MPGRKRNLDSASDENSRTHRYRRWSQRLAVVRCCNSLRRRRHRPGYSGFGGLLNRSDCQAPRRALHQAAWIGRRFLPSPIGFAVAAALPGPGDRGAWSRARSGQRYPGYPWPMVAGFVVGDRDLSVGRRFRTGGARPPSLDSLFLGRSAISAPLYLIYLAYQLWTAPTGAIPVARAGHSQGRRRNQTVPRPACP